MRRGDFTLSALGKARVMVVLVAPLALAVTYSGFAGVSRAAPHDVTPANPTMTLLPQDNLQPAPQDGKTQLRALRSLIRSLEFAEKLQREGDAQLLVVARESADMYDSFLRDKREVEARIPGARMEVPEREQFLSPKKTRVRWAFKDYMVRYEWEITPDSQNRGGAWESSAFSYDGRHLRRYYYGKNEGDVSIQESPKTPDILASSLTLSAWGGTSFSQLLKKQGTVYEGTQAIGDTLCRLVTVSQSEVGSVQIWFSLANGNRAKRVVYSRQPRPGGRGAYVVSEVSGFRRFGHSWFPTGGHKVWYSTDEHGSRDWRTATEWSLVSYSREVPDDLFTFRFPEGTRVADMSADAVRWFTSGEDFNGALRDGAKQ